MGGLAWLWLGFCWGVCKGFALVLLGFAWGWLGFGWGVGKGFVVVVWGVLLGCGCGFV